MIQSPRLKKAVLEVEKVFKKYDVGGSVIFADGKGHGEFRIFIESPSWSLVRVLSDKSVHVKVHKKTKPVETEKTVNMLFVLSDVLNHVTAGIGQLKYQIAQSVEVQETDGKWDFGKDKNDT